MTSGDKVDDISVRLQSLCAKVNTSHSHGSGHEQTRQVHIFTVARQPHANLLFQIGPQHAYSIHHLYICDIFLIFYADKILELKLMEYIGIPIKK